MEKIEQLREELTTAKAALHNADSYAFLYLDSDSYKKFNKAYDTALDYITQMQQMTVFKPHKGD